MTVSVVCNQSQKKPSSSMPDRTKKASFWSVPNCYDYQNKQQAQQANYNHKKKRIFTRCLGGHTRRAFYGVCGGCAHTHPPPRTTAQTQYTHICGRHSLFTHFRSCARRLLGVGRVHHAALMATADSTTKQSHSGTLFETSAPRVHIDTRARSDTTP